MLHEQEKVNINTGFTNIHFTISQITTIVQNIKDQLPAIHSLLEKRFNNQAEIHKTTFDRLLSIEEQLSILDNEIPQNLSNIVLSSDHFNTFLSNQIAAFNLHTQYLIVSHSHTEIINFINKLNVELSTLTTHDNNLIKNIANLPNIILDYYRTLNSIGTNLYILMQLEGFTGNIVMIGANGSGKSSFARSLNNTLGSNITILAAQHLLYYTKSDTISTSGTELNTVHNFQRNLKNTADSNFSRMISSDMNNLIKALLADYIDCSTNYYEHDTKTTAYLTQTINIWNEIVEHRTMHASRTGITISGNHIMNYDFNYLSDGEKAIFYYIGHVLLSKPNSYVIVDEPENHLHLTICNKLWDCLEQQRPDCKFIYLTHNLTFATTRTQSTILWNKCYLPPNTWDFQQLPSNSEIPEVLLMELVGSRKTICFCEGDNQSSIDYKLYSILFPQLTIIPVSGHRDVISYVSAYNASHELPNKAIGIIDGDNHSEAQIESWKDKGIYTLQVNEVENLLCTQFLLETAISTFCSKDNALQLFMDEFWNLLDNEKFTLATSYENTYINQLFTENYLHEKKDITALITELQNITTPD